MHGGNNPVRGVNASRFVHSGIYSAFLGQNGPLGFLSQTLPTKAGQRYLLSFWLDNPAIGTPNEFIASWNGTTLFDGADLGEFAWTNLQFAVSATSASTALEFMFRNDQNAFGLDDISVQPLPAPVLGTVTETQGTIPLTWSTVPGLAYQVQFNTGLTQTNWANLGTALTATNTTAFVSDTLGPDPQRFYRIALLP